MIIRGQYACKKEIENLRYEKINKNSNAKRIESLQKVVLQLTGIRSKEMIYKAKSIAKLLWLP